MLTKNSLSRRAVFVVVLKHSWMYKLKQHGTCTLTLLLISSTLNWYDSGPNQIFSGGLATAATCKFAAHWHLLAVTWTARHQGTVAVDEDVAAVVRQRLRVVLPTDGTVVQVGQRQSAVNENTLSGIPHNISTWHTWTIASTYVAKKIDAHSNNKSNDSFSEVHIVKCLNSPIGYSRQQHGRTKHELCRVALQLSFLQRNAHDRLSDTILK